jgi:hypothetical protein
MSRESINVQTGEVTILPDAPTPPPLTQRELDTIDSENAKQELIRIDLNSIRDIRKWIAAQPSASKELKDHEASALAARARIK